ncbi:MAG: NAD(P)/FAD-dependent oxidoreductase [Akkermansiaceae bacterium]
MSSEPRHLVIGGGVIGLCSAYFLAKKGEAVTVIDRNAAHRNQCSDKNAGMVVPSHFIPLAAPGVVTQGLKWMLNPRSPFFIRPRLNRDLISWCWQFLRHSNKRHVENSQELLRDLNLESRSLFEQLADELDFPLVRKGLLNLCQTEAGLHEEAEVAKLANALGVEAEVCSPERLCELDPDIEINAKGGIWFSKDCHLDSQLFLTALKEGIKKYGGTFIAGDVSNFHLKDDEVMRMTTKNGEEIPVSHLVLAAGSWSPELARGLNLELPMQAGKGYSVTLENPSQLPTLCSLLKEGRVAVTPMGGKLRIAGTMEICGNDTSIDHRRLEGIFNSFRSFFPQFQRENFKALKPWSGLRPCTPDGLPYIGPAPGIKNVTIATGHAMLGLSLGPVTGRMIAEGATDPRLDPIRFQ